MDIVTKEIKEAVLRKKEEWEKKSTMIELNLWECANIHAAIKITLLYLEDVEGRDNLYRLEEKFRELRFAIENKNEN